MERDRKRMQPWRVSRAVLAILLAATAACPPAQALVSFNDSHDHIYVTGTLGMSRDSNINATSGSPGDIVYTSSLSFEYTRRAGWIGVNASTALTAARYGKTTSDNFNNPSFNVELNKQSGRTTGALTLSAMRESRADSAVNVHSTSWSYNAGLNVAYPIVERFKFSGGLGYSGRIYVNQPTLDNLKSYTANADLFYLLTTERDLTFDYRYRYNPSTAQSSTTDHALSLGLTGRLIQGINGAFHAGYQVRIPSGAGNTDPTFHSWTAGGSASYAINRKTNLTAQVSKDFSTTATDASVDTTSASLSAQYAYNSHLSFNLSGGGGDSRFLGQNGRIVRSVGPPLDLGPNRHDTYANWDATVSYSVNDHLKANLGYGWFHNWSNVSYANFTRTTSWNVNYSSRW